MENKKNKEKIIAAAVTVSAIFAFALAAYYMLPVALTMGHY